MRSITVFPLTILFLLSRPAPAQQQAFEIDPLEFRECLPRWDRNLPKSNPANRLEVINQLRTLLKYEKAKIERIKLLHRLSINYYREYEANQNKQYLVQAVKVMQKLIQGHPGYNLVGDAYLLIAEAHLILGEAIWSSGREKEALKIFKVFIRYYPKNPESIRAYMFFAEFFFKSQKYKRALTMFQKAESFGKSEYSYCLSHRIATCYHQLGQTNEAIEWLNKANELRKK